jgi:DNA topoisomerase IA
VPREAWDVDPQLLFGAETTKVPTSGAVCAHLEHEAKGADHLVLWLDCDREGENICFEVAPHRSHRTAPHRTAPHRTAPHPALSERPVRAQLSR